jgi:hypothetical protein
MPVSPEPGFQNEKHGTERLSTYSQSHYFLTTGLEATEAALLQYERLCWTRNPGLGYWLNVNGCQLTLQ